MDILARCGKDDLYSSTLEMGTRALNWCAVDRGKDRIGLVALIDNDHRLTSREQGDGNAV